MTNPTKQVVQRIRNDEVFEEYDAGELPEQIAVSDSGVMFVSDRNQGAVLRVEANDS